MHHHHHHHHDHGPAVGDDSHAASHARYNRAFAISVVLNLSFTLIQAFYALVANSMSLLADAAHNFGDVLGLLFAWGASYLLTRPATERYSYGYKRTTILAAIFNGLLLVATSAVIAYEALNKVFSPVDVNEVIVMIVASIGIVINGGTALLFMRGRKDDLNIKGAYLHLASDALISIGVVVGGLAIYLTGWNWLDPVIGLLIVVTILLSTWGLMRDSVNLILDAVPHGLERKHVKEWLERLEGVTAVHDLHIWGLSTKEIAMTAHLVMPKKNLRDADIKEINQVLRKEYNISHITLQVESGCEHHPCEQETTC